MMATRATGGGSGTGDASWPVHTLPAYKKLAVAARQLQKQCKAAGASVTNAFAVLDQAMTMLAQPNYGQALVGNIVPVLVPKPLASRTMDVAHSLATHALHCAEADCDIHYAQAAVQKIRSSLSDEQMQASQNLHRRANKAKHDNLMHLGRSLIAGAENPAMAFSDLAAADTSILAIQSRGFRFQVDECSSHDLEQLQFPIVPPPPIWEPLPAKYSVIGEQEAHRDLLDDQADTIALLCGRLDYLNQQNLIGSSPKGFEWNINAEEWFPPNVPVMSGLGSPYVSSQALVDSGRIASSLTVQVAMKKYSFKRTRATVAFPMSLDAGGECKQQ